jgi:hypothetical protein
MLSQTFSLAHMSAYDVVPQMRFSKGAINTLASRMPWRETTALGQLWGCNVPTARRRYVASPEEVMAMGACYLARCLLWNFMCCLEGSPTSMSLASRFAPVPLSPLAPYPCEERARSASGRHPLGGHGAGREAQRKRARAQEGARQEGASTGRREHRGARAQEAQAESHARE